MKTLPEPTPPVFYPESQSIDWLFRLIKSLPLFVGILLLSAALHAADPTQNLPKGSIIAFLPDPNSADYSDMAGMRRWLGGKGWAICDGRNGTPDLHGRYLLGTEEYKDAGQRLGSSTHQHKIRSRTGREEGRTRRFNTGGGYAIRLPQEGHAHSIDALASPQENLPLSTRVIFIIRVK